MELPVESDHIEEKKGCTEPVVTEDDIDKAWLELSDDARALSVLGAEGLELVHELERPALLAAAVYFGRTRLIDNRVIGA